MSSGPSAFATANTKSAVLTIALVSTMLFWGLDDYYLWLERAFVELHNKVAGMSDGPKPADNG